MESRTRIDSDYLFAAFFSLAIVGLAVRWILVAPSGQRWLLPILAYQDLVVCAVLAWLFDATFAISSMPTHRRVVTLTGWVVCLGDAALLGLHLLIYAKVRHPFTYRLFEISDNLRGIEGSIAESLAPARTAVLATTVSVIVLSEGLWCFAPRLLARMHAAFKSRRAVALILLFVVFGSYSANRWVNYPPAAVSPAWALVSSVFHDTKPVVADSIPPEYLADFDPVANNCRVAEDIPIDGAIARTSRRPMNVLMVVMESVGAKRLQLYGAPFDDSPNLMRLARHGVLFERVYAAEAITSSAMAGLFCSIYPYHDWITVTRMAPDLAVKGLAELLLQHGYRTTFMSPVPLAYDKDDEFLRRHGFHDVIDKPRYTSRAMDSELTANAIQWIKQDPSHPFFLTLWTADSHHPYLSSSVRDYHVNDSYLNRYLNGIVATDKLIEQITDSLESMRLADDTLLVITGDHGEAFGEHQETGHGFTAYDEEVHVPLLMVNARLFAHPRIIHSVGRQIDIAPTVLDLLGYRPPDEWQGTSLLSGLQPQRAFMFAVKGDYVFGLIDGGSQYVYDYDRNREELYNLLDDPDEKHDLSGAPELASTLRQDHLRIEAWLSFQNGYIGGLIPQRP
jgi:lipoteichoic acid synthase